jgi:hypothetical protein
MKGDDSIWQQKKQPPKKLPNMVLMFFDFLGFDSNRLYGFLCYREAV